MDNIEQLEKQLDSFNAEQRKDALKQLCAMVENGGVSFEKPYKAVNVHCHSFFSYNSYGYSPSKLAWLAKKKGLAAAATVDFDVLDALDEFLEACGMLDLRGFGGLETRVFVPEFADKEINSPGEPGISYYMAVGFTDSNLPQEQKNFLNGLKSTAQQRNLDMLQRVNNYLAEIKLDYEKDVLKLTPSSNVTERHICLAYAQKAAEVFKDAKELDAYWSDKLSEENGILSLPISVALTNAIRAKTMKKGGVGYVIPDKDAFPLMADVNKFALACGAVPTITWLNGLSAGERQMEELIEVSLSTGAAAINIIPDRNYTPGVKDEKLEKLYEVVQLAKKFDLPVIAGTEMNSPGQKFVDDFETEELKPIVDECLKGACILYAHSVMQTKMNAGYTSSWAKENFESIKEKNIFFETIGKKISPKTENMLDGIPEVSKPVEILNKIDA